jgi:outer membrane protein assembly factor BamA
MDVDSRDHKSNPKQGMLWNLDLRGYTGLNNASNRFTRMQSDVSFYYTIRIPSSLTIATRIGGGFNRGSYEYYQGQFLSGPVHLRGFRKTRFVGDEAAFGNAELRYGFANIRNRVIPTRVGINAFYDIGRVWFENEISNTWHRGYGGGLWFAPLDAAVFAIELGSSKEETRLYFRMGFMF